ncbi:MAG: hypothetical protein HXX81_05265 [Campylobacterales bacterium]|nr:hypothetical protein [Campylobacterales bacterium]
MRSLTINIALDIKKDVGLKWITLIADNDKLSDYYISEFGFVKSQNSKNKQNYLFVKL